MTATVLGIALSGPLLMSAFDDGPTVEFIGPATPSERVAPSASPDPTTPDLSVKCAPVDPPPQNDQHLVTVYVPCRGNPDDDTRSVADTHRWVANRSPVELVRAVFDCPTLDELGAGRQCLFRGPGQGLVTAVDLDGEVARITLNNNIDGIANLNAPDLFFAALRTTVFANYGAINRIEYALDFSSDPTLEPSDDPNALCRLTGAADGCAETTRDA